MCIVVNLLESIITSTSCKFWVSRIIDLGYDNHRKETTACILAKAEKVNSMCATSFIFCRNKFIQIKDKHNEYSRVSAPPRWFTLFRCEKHACPRTFWTSYWVFGSVQTDDQKTPWYTPKGSRNCRNVGRNVGDSRKLRWEIKRYFVGELNRHFSPSS